MSNTSIDGIPLAVLTVEYSMNLVANYAEVGAFALWIFEYLLTLPMEVSEIWGARVTGAQILFYSNRYVPVLFWVSNILASLYPRSNLTCSVVGRLASASGITIGLTMRSIFMLRTFAIYRGNWLIISGLAPLAASKAALDIVKEFILQSDALDPVLVTCTQNMTDSNLILYQKLNYASDFIILGFDSVVLILTLSKTLKLVRESRQLGIKNSVSFIILHDGLLYYCGLIVLTLALIILAFPQDVQTETENNLASIVASFIDVLQFVLVNRLVLNLRGSNRPGVRHGGEATTVPLPELYFASDHLVGNLGAPFQTSYDQETGEDEIDTINPSGQPEREDSQELNSEA